MSAVGLAVPVAYARDLARSLLGGMGDRWRHTAAVARRAEELAPAIEGDDLDTLVSAAWLHDIGYADEVRDTGFHPLDGARYLNRLGWPRRVSSLVAHHSGALYVAHVAGTYQALMAFGMERTPLADALTYADQTTGPRGEPMSVRLRMEDMLLRHGPDSPNAKVHHLREPHLLAAAERVERRMGGRLPVRF